ncbi:MAG: hypothetical protein IKX45_06115 [Bacteroidales bacterium]|nr:hypothetical protein [Bacteroidales bacterium]
MDKIIIAGIQIPLRKWAKNELKGVPAIYSFNYRFYDFFFKGIQMILLQSVKKHDTPKTCRTIADHLEKLFGCSVVFYSDNIVYYERKRYIEHGVFYISGERNAYLPMLVSSPVSKRKAPTRLSAAAQYLILYHLQVESLEHKPLSNLAETLPYSYVSIAKSVQNMEELGICRCERDAAGSKSIDFGFAGKDLWEKAKPFMCSPVKERYYCTGLPEGHFPIAGISALSAHSHLSPDPEKTFAVYAMKWKKEQFENLNTFEGPYIVEFWRYPIIGNKTVDKLSLYLSLENDPDPRVKKEVDFVFDSVWKR